MERRNQRQEHVRTPRQTSLSELASQPPLLGQLWWIPLLFVVVSLLVLSIVPIVVEHRVRSVRNGVVAASDGARVLVNDLEAAFATELLQSDSSAAPANASVRAEMGQVAVDADSLAITVRSVDPEATQRFEHLRTELAVWSGPVATPNASELRQARAILATADSLDLHLMTVSDTERASVRRLEQLDVASAIVLVPLALIAIGIVIWGGERVLHFARVAEHERAEVIRSAEARAALLRGVTHDVKNPLGAASGYAHLLADGVAGDLTERQVEMVRRIQRLVDTSVRTVSDMLEFARADGTTMRLDHVQVDLGAIAREVLDDHQGMAREREIALSSDLAPVPVLTDPTRVHQVLTNLLSNAIKYTPHGGTIAVRTVRDDGGGVPRVGVEVRDTGPGIPPELRERVFDEFVRADSAVSAGNGLGLAISRRFARMLGGDVVFAPNQPSGAVFTLWLDTTRRAESTAAQPASAHTNS